VIGKDDNRLYLCPHDVIPNKHRAYAIWFGFQRGESDRLVNLPETRIILNTDVEWERDYDTV